MKVVPYCFALLFALVMFGCQNQTETTENEKTPELEKVLVENTEPGSNLETNDANPAVVSDAPENKEVKTSEEQLPVKTKNDKKPAAKEPVVKATKDKTTAETTPIPEANQPDEPAVAETRPAPTVPTIEKPAEEKPTAPPAFSHNIWDALTKKYVSSSGKVNYNGFKKDMAQLDAYIELLKKNPPSGSKASQLAYWINVYNAYTVKMIADNYPVSSITKLHGGQPWKVSWVEVGGKTYSLDEVENTIIRPKFKDGRIHFAVNCAAKSCPPLLNRAWTEANLERYLDQQTKAFINNTTHNQIESNSAKLSKIFEWYAADFGDILTYINKYSETKVKPGSSISYNEYDWSLND